MKEGSGELQKSSKIAPPSVPPPEALYEISGRLADISHRLVASSRRLVAFGPS